MACINVYYLEYLNITVTSLIQTQSMDATAFFSCYSIYVETLNRLMSHIKNPTECPP
jgi:hypothetical protein